MKNMTKGGLNDEMMMKWETDDALLDLNTINYNASMYNPTCDSATIIIGGWIEWMDFREYPTNSTL